ncbi:MAG: hypothetical protein HEQ21_08070 [Blastomonas sp.]|uniref:Uncharacterized protein n=1 Tax=Blastomonas fulva TaxID=1550728 RepID=A0ABM6M2L8_9SPHN|nr:MULTISPECIES: hypothetical protein [Blastomonas]ASR50091.1 hypothetical protein B5J99_00230 [Blastomonas fulva]MCO5792761.1 hypothetical protein [Blastomonas sp.]
MNGKWQAQMQLWCGAVMVFGLVLMSGAFEATGQMANILFDILDGPGPVTWDPALRFSLALMGAVTLGWGATVLAVVRGTGDMPAAQALALWRGITAALLLWYVVDSALSVATGFWRNALSNTVLIGWYLLLMRRNTATRAVSAASS